MAEVASDLEVPSWLIDLESRLKSVKQHHQLGHEFGAGSACLKCEKCPGLDLHFWRKKCISCKCKKEDHDVPPDDSDIRLEILLTNPESNHYRSFRGELEMKIRKGNPNLETSKPGVVIDKPAPMGKVAFDWLPQETPSELAAAYMRELPLNKLPISGSDGARYRQIQLNHQIPLYDISPDVRHKLPLAGQQEFQSYLEAVRSNVGVGKIQKICQKSMLEESVPQTAIQRPEVAKTMKKTGGRQSPLLNMSDNRHTNQLEKYNNNNLNVNPKPFKPYQPSDSTYEGLSKSDDTNLPFSSSPFILKPPSSYIDRSKSPKHDKYLGVKASSDNLPPLPLVNMPSLARHKVDTLNSNTEFPCPISDGHPHDKNKVSNISKLASLFDKSSIIGSIDPLNNTDLPVPEDNSVINSPNTMREPRHIRDYTRNIQMGFDSHPEGYRPTDVLHSNLAIPSNPEGYGSANSLEEGQQLDNHKDLLAVDKTLDCWQCKEPLQFGSVAVVADRAGPDKAWHPNCFICCVCNELLVDLVYFYHHQKVYCGRHYADMKNIKRCCACDELIFVNEFTLAEDNAYHVNHFCCSRCDLPLAGNKYIMYDNQPNCLNCYDEIYSDKCQCCGLAIRAEQQGVKLKQLTWHASPDCFKCAGCNNSLLNSKFVLADNRPYCSKQCVPS